MPKETKKRTTTTEQVVWKLPEVLVDDCQELNDGGHWAEGFREMMQSAAERNLKLSVAGESQSCGVSLPSDVMTYLRREANRLSKETGQKWSPMQVAREIWRQARLPVLTERRNAK